MESAYFDDHPYHEVQEAAHTESVTLDTAELDPAHRDALELAQQIEEQQIRVEKTAHELELAHDHLTDIHARMNRGEEVTEDEIGHANHEVDRLFAKETEARRKLHKLEMQFNDLNLDS
jgi:predicted RNase H-like nuclease (RuvC/YqgF family)